MALEPLRADELQELGVIEAGETPLRASVRLVPHAELLLAGNRYPDETPDGTPGDYVATATAPSAILASLTVRRPASRGLDIGTGSGVQALWAARHCERVVAVDVNRRALNLAAFNARLNGVANVEFREGSLFQPVAGERFDLIVCNAPYVVSPDARYAYRDSGFASDDFCERLVRETPAHLEEGGFAHLLIGWILTEEDWTARPRSWIEGRGCDCWLLRGVERDPVRTRRSGTRTSPTIRRATLRRSTGGSVISRGSAPKQCSRARRSSAVAPVAGAGSAPTGSLLVTPIPPAITSSVSSAPKMTWLSSLRKDHSLVRPSG